MFYACKGFFFNHESTRRVETFVDLSIRELEQAVPMATGYNGVIEWVTTKPDGTPNKQLDLSRLDALSLLARIPLGEGPATTLALFRTELAK